MDKKILNPTTAIAPVPLALVTCGDMEKSNIITIAWTGVLCSDPVIIYISVRPGRYSYDMIKNTKEFVINLANEELVEAAKFCGKTSGKDTDKFAELNLTKEKGNKVSSPIIKEAPINLECKVIEIKELGVHHVFIAEVVSVNADASIVNENGVIDYAKANLMTYAGGKYFKASI